MNDRQRLELLRAAMDHLERTKIGYVEFKRTGKGSEWREARRRLLKLEEDLAPDPVPALGPITRGGSSLLKVSLTHNTDGISLYPAFDTAWIVGQTIIAPEALVVIAPYTSSNPGAAFYARGVSSNIRYWFAHLYRSHRLGTRFAKGQEIGRTAATAVGAAHCHCGVNVELLIGARRQLKYGRDGNGPDYTYGAPTIGAQLRELLAA